MSDIYEKFTHAGLNVEIFHDHNAESPNEWHDEEVFLVGFHEREFWVQRKGFDLKTVKAALFNKGRNEDDEIDPDAREIMKKYHIIPLEAYIHSGVVLFISGGCGVDRQWDVSQVGAVFVSKQNTRFKKVALERAKDLIETWNQYLGNDIYRFMVKDDDGEVLDSCSGLYGSKEVICEAKSAAEYCAKAKREKRQAQLKTWIKHRVPLEKRVFNN